MGSVLLVEEEVLLPLGPSMALRSHRAMRLGSILGGGNGGGRASRRGAPLASTLGGGGGGGAGLNRGFAGVPRGRLVDDDDDGDDDDDDDDGVASISDSGFGQVSDGDEVDAEMNTLMEDMVDSRTLFFFSPNLEAAFTNYSLRLSTRSRYAPFMPLIGVWVIATMSDFVVQDFSFTPTTGAAWGPRQDLLYVVLMLRVLGFVLCFAAIYVYDVITRRLEVARENAAVARRAAAAARAPSPTAAEAEADGQGAGDNTPAVELEDGQVPPAVVRHASSSSRLGGVSRLSRQASRAGDDDEHSRSRRSGDDGEVEGESSQRYSQAQWRAVHAQLPYTFYSRLTSFIAATDLVRPALLIMLHVIHMLCAYLLWMSLSAIYLTPFFAMILWGQSDVQRKWIFAAAFNVSFVLAWGGFSLLEVLDVSAFPLRALPVDGRLGLATIVDWVVIMVVCCVAVALRARAGYNLELFDRQSFLLNTQIKSYERNMNMVLLRMLPKPIVDRMKSSAMQQAWERFPSVTIMFSAICDFDKIASRIEAPHLVMLLNAIFLDLDAKLAEFRAYGAYKVETIGEIYLVSCGCPFEQALHADVMCDLALRALSSLRELFPQLRMKLGLHSGAVVAGVIGVHYPRYRIIGDTINTSSRMGSTCRPDTIQLSSDTARLVMTPEDEVEAGKEIRSDPVGTALHPSESICYALSDLGSIQVKGKGEMRTWRLEGRRKGVTPRYTFSPSPGTGDETGDGFDTGIDHIVEAVGGARALGGGGGGSGGGGGGDVDDAGGMDGGNYDGGYDGGYEDGYEGEMDPAMVDTLHAANDEYQEPDDMVEFAAAHMDGDDDGRDGAQPGPSDADADNELDAGGVSRPDVDQGVAPIHVGRDYYGHRDADEALETETVNPYSAMYDVPIRTPRYSEYYCEVDDVSSMASVPFSRPAFPAAAPNMPGAPQEQFVLADHVHLLNNIAAATGDIPPPGAAAPLSSQTDDEARPEQSPITSNPDGTAAQGTRSPTDNDADAVRGAAPSRSTATGHDRAAGLTINVVGSGGVSIGPLHDRARELHASMGDSEAHHATHLTYGQGSATGSLTREAGSPLQPRLHHSVADAVGGSSSGDFPGPQHSLGDAHGLPNTGPIPPRAPVPRMLPPTFDPRFTSSMQTTVSLPVHGPPTAAAPGDTSMFGSASGANVSGGPIPGRSSFYAYGHVETGSLASAHTVGGTQRQRTSLRPSVGSPAAVASPPTSMRTASSASAIGPHAGSPAHLSPPAAMHSPQPPHAATLPFHMGAAPPSANSITGGSVAASSGSIPVPSPMSQQPTGFSSSETPKPFLRQISTATTPAITVTPSSAGGIAGGFSPSGTRRISGTPLSQARMLAHGTTMSGSAAANAAALAAVVATAGSGGHNRRSVGTGGIAGAPIVGNRSSQGSAVFGGSPFMVGGGVPGGSPGAGDDLRPFVRLGRMARRRDSLVDLAVNSQAADQLRSPGRAIGADVIGSLNAVLAEALSGVPSLTASGFPVGHGTHMTPSQSYVLASGSPKLHGTPGTASRSLRMQPSILSPALSSTRTLTRARPAAAATGLAPPTPRGGSNPRSTPALVRSVGANEPMSIVAAVRASQTGSTTGGATPREPNSARAFGGMLSVARNAANMRHGVPTPRTRPSYVVASNASTSTAMGSGLVSTTVLMSGSGVTASGSGVPPASVIAAALHADASPSFSTSASLSSLRGMPATDGPDAVIRLMNHDSVPDDVTQPDHGSPLFQHSARAVAAAQASAFVLETCVDPPTSRARVLPISLLPQTSPSMSDAEAMNGGIFGVTRATPRTLMTSQSHSDTPGQWLLPGGPAPVLSFANGSSPMRVQSSMSATSSATATPIQGYSATRSRGHPSPVRLMTHDNAIDVDALTAQVRRLRGRRPGGVEYVTSPYAGTRMIGVAATASASSGSSTLQVPPTASSLALNEIIMGSPRGAGGGDLSARGHHTPLVSARRPAASQMARHEGAFAPPQLSHMRLASAPAPMVSFVNDRASLPGSYAPSAVGSVKLMPQAVQKPPLSARRTARGSATGPTGLRTPRFIAPQADAAQSYADGTEVPGQVQEVAPVERVLKFSANITTIAPDGELSAIAAPLDSPTDRSAAETATGDGPDSPPVTTAPSGAVADDEDLPVIEPLTHEQGLQWDAKIAVALQIAQAGGDTVSASAAAPTVSVGDAAAPVAGIGASKSDKGGSVVEMVQPATKRVASAAGAASNSGRRKRDADEHSVTSVGSEGSTASLASLIDNQTHTFYANTNPVNFFLYPGNPLLMIDSLLLSYHNGEGLWGWITDCLRSKAYLRERRRLRRAARGEVQAENEDDDELDAEEEERRKQDTAEKEKKKRQQRAVKEGAKVDDQGNVYRDDDDDDQQFRKMLQEAFERAARQNTDTYKPEEEAATAPPPPPLPPRLDPEEELKQLQQKRKEAEEERLRKEAEDAKTFFFMDDDLVADLEAGFGLLYHEVFADQMRVFVACFTIVATLFCALYATVITFNDINDFNWVASSSTDQAVALAFAGVIFVCGAASVAVLTITSLELQRYNEALSLHHRILNQGNELQNQDLRGYTLHSAVTNMNVSRNYTAAAQSSGGYTVSTGNITLATGGGKNKPATVAASKQLTRSWVLNHLQAIIGICLFVFVHASIVALGFTHLLYTGVGAALLIMMLFCISMQSTLLFPAILVIVVTVYGHFIAMVAATDAHLDASTWVYVVLVAAACLLLLRTAYDAEQAIRVNYINTHRAVHEEGRALYLLSQMLPPEVLLTIVHTDNSNFAQHFETASILFADVVSFTAMSAQLLPEELVMFLNVMFSVFDQCATIRSVYKVETIGDCYFACSGIVHSLTSFEALPAREHACNLVHFGMDIIFFLSLLPHPLASKRAKQMRLAAKRAQRERRAERERDRELAKTGFFRVRGPKQKKAEPELPPIPPMGLRIGIHTGYVTAGVVGRTMPRYHLFGRSVTVAQKMESSGVKNRIHVSEATKSLIEKDFVFEERGHVMVGKELGARAALAAAALRTAVQRDRDRDVGPGAPRYAFGANKDDGGAVGTLQTIDDGEESVPGSEAELFKAPEQLHREHVLRATQRRELVAVPLQQDQQQQVTTTLVNVTKAVKGTQVEEEQEQEPIGLFMVKGSFAIPVRMWFPSDDSVQWPPPNSTQEDVVW